MHKTAEATVSETTRPTATTEPVRRPARVAAPSERARKAPTRKPAPAPILATSAEIVDFIDNTTMYKDKVLKFEVVAELDHGCSLRAVAQGGGAVQFFACLGRATLRMIIQIPQGLDVPSAGLFDWLYVTFRCTDGELNSGNIATSVSRLPIR
jgi:hypothetical protein